MIAIQNGTLTIAVKGYTVNNGLPYFQRAVPTALKQRFGKATIKIPLRAENGNFLVQCHRLYNSWSALFRAMAEDSSLVPPEIETAALLLVNQGGLKPGDGLNELTRPEGWTGSFDPTPHMSAFSDHLEEIFSGKPNAVTNAAFRALQGPFPVRLSEAFAIYLDNHPKGGDRKFQESQRQHWEKLVALVGDKAVEQLTRQDARDYRDRRLEGGVAPSTVQREINVLRAVLNKAIREIPLNVKNQFEGLTVPHGNRNAKDREGYSRREVQQLVSQALLLDDERRRIVVVLALTGARLAEIVGLRKQDVDLRRGCLLIREHSSRSLKTPASKRDIPLLPIALEVVKRQLEGSKGNFLFPSYASKTSVNSDGASAALNKWARKLVAEKSMHSFRHTLRDQLRAVSCQEAISKEIGGWSSTHDVSVGYGTGYPDDLKRDWLARAYAWLKLPNFGEMSDA